MARYLVCSEEPWGQRITWPTDPADQWEIVTSRAGLADAVMPRTWSASAARPVAVSQFVQIHAIFVLHWHHILPAWFVGVFRCIGFHASDLPWYRGGDPIGNQQARGVLETQLTAFRLDAGLDTGPILLKRPLSLAGSKAEVLTRIAGLVPGMITEILVANPPEIPQPHRGSVYRRKDVEAARLERA